MRLGVANISHSSPEEWAQKLKDIGCSAVVFPCTWRDSDAKIDAYASVCHDYGFVIAEVGVWCNPLSENPAEKAENMRKCKEQLRLAERVGANCCVNVAGTTGPKWDGGYPQNFSRQMFDKIVESIKEIIADVSPHKTYYALEPMPWMIPHGPENYQSLLDAVGNDRFAVHMDMVNMISSPERYFFCREFIDKCFGILGGRIRSCHVKDVKLLNGLTFQLKETFCGDGGFDLLNYAIQADKCSPDMPFILEHLPDDESYIASAGYIRKLLSNTGIQLK